MTVESVPVAEPVADVAPRGRFDVSRLVRALGYVAVALSVAAAAATFLLLMGLTPIAPTPDIVLTGMIVNGALVAFLILVVAWEVGSLLLARRRGRAAARLHIRIVALFSIIAAGPAVLLALIAGFTLDRGLDNWFSTRTRAIVDNSLSIAQAYAEQQAVLLRADATSLKQELERAPSLFNDAARFETFLTVIAKERSLPGVFVVDGDGSPVAQARDLDRRNFPPPVAEALQQAGGDPANIVIIAPGATNVIGAITVLAGYDDKFLYVARPLDPKVVRYLALTNDSVAEYRTLEASRYGVQLAFGILFLGVTVVVLLSAIWLGIGFANRLVTPIRRLIDAAKEVSQGNLSVAVQPRNSDGDVAQLGTTFNTMTSQLRSQREELLSASDQIDSRRRFIEAVLSGVTAGVIGIDSEGRIAIANRMSLNFLGVSADAVVGQPIAELVPEMAPTVSAALADSRPEHRDQITVVRNGRERTINIRVTTERAAGQSHGYVITLDDITDLVTAQRHSAWADVARRIAHEIKNPLTPIQLSAERLKRKFGAAIGTDREVFDQCTDTIIRQVGDIGRMVDEFSSFARMPKPTMEPGNLAEAIREAVFVVSVSRPEIAFKVAVPDAPLMGRFDARLMGQALANLVKNATEAIAAVPATADKGGAVTVAARETDRGIVVDVIDNGVGLPRENRHRLLEPYMTTREKGTGLGLAIVAKIIEEHGGRLELHDAPEVATGGRGAMIRIVLPRAADTAGAAPATAAQDQRAEPESVA